MKINLVAALFPLVFAACGQDDRKTTAPTPTQPKGFQFRSSDYSAETTNSCLESIGLKENTAVQNYCQCVGTNTTAAIVNKYGGSDRVPPNATLTDEEAEAAISTCETPVIEIPTVEEKQTTETPTQPEPKPETPSTTSKFNPDEFKSEVKSSCAESLSGMFSEEAITTYCQCAADGLLGALIAKYGRVETIPENAELSEQEAERATEHCELKEPEPAVPPTPAAPKFNVPGARNINAGNLSLNTSSDNTVFDFTRKGTDDDHSITSTWKFNLSQTSKLSFRGYLGISGCSINSIHMVVLKSASDEVLDVLSLPANSSGNTVYPMNANLQPGSYRLLMVIHSSGQCAVAAQFKANSVVIN
jgi:hypothetical protein